MRLSMIDNTLLVERGTPLAEQGQVRSEEEVLIADDRSVLSPSQMVEQKLIGWMKSSPLLVSHMQRQLKPSFR
jgi:hypothetical protein